MIKTSDLYLKLIENISSNEWNLLKNNGNSLVISEFNRDTILDMKDNINLISKDIPIADLKDLSNKLKSYLNEFMSDKPQGHKWIIIASLYLTFIAEKPMHPIEIAKIKVKNIDNRNIYFCPLKSHEPHSICSYCVCKFIDKKSPLQ